MHLAFEHDRLDLIGKSSEMAGQPVEQAPLGFVGGKTRAAAFAAALSSGFQNFRNEICQPPRFCQVFPTTSVSSITFVEECRRGDCLG